jgi:hypothetical protein
MNQKQIEERRRLKNNSNIQDMAKARAEYDRQLLVNADLRTRVTGPNTIPSFISGYYISGEHPELTGPFLSMNVETPNWYYGQIQSSRALHARFAIAAIAIMYNEPQLIYLPYRDAEIFVNRYVDDVIMSPQSAFAPASIAKMDEVQDTDDDLHTEIEYLHRYSTDPNPAIEFRARVLDILWNIRFTKDISEGYLLTPDDESVSDTYDLDPVVGMNDYARAILGEYNALDDYTVSDAKTGVMPLTDSSIRIYLTSKGVLDRRCGFYKNCVFPILAAGGIDEISQKVGLLYSSQR